MRFIKTIIVLMGSVPLLHAQQLNYPNNSSSGGGGSGTVSTGGPNTLGIYSSSGTTISPLTTANNGVLVTSAGGVPSISTTLPAAVQANITPAFSGITSGTNVSAAMVCGTGCTLTTSGSGSITASQVGTCTVTSGALACPSSITSGSGGGTTGSLQLGGSASGLVTIQVQAASGTFNLNLPTTVGTSGQPLLSAAGGSSPMTWGSTTGSGNFVLGTSPTITTPVIAQIVPGADFSLSQNSVTPVVSVNSGAVANTLYIKGGQIGFATSSPSNFAGNNIFTIQAGSAGGGIDIYASAARQTFFGFDVTNQLWTVTNLNAKPITFATSAAEKVRILNGLMVGTATDPGNGVVNLATGLRIGNTATTGHVLRGNGTNYIDAQLAYSDLSGTPTAGSGASYQVNFQPGLMTSVLGTTGVYGKIVNTSTVDNLIGSAISFTCAVNPIVTMFECGTSSTCASPTTIGTVTITAAGQAFTGTVSNAAVTAGDFIGWSVSAGTCTSLDLSATAQVHSN